MAKIKDVAMIFQGIGVRTHGRDNQIFWINGLPDFLRSRAPLALTARRAAAPLCERWRSHQVRMQYVL